MQHFLHARILDHLGEARIGLRGQQPGIAIIARKFQIVRGVFGVALLRERFGHEEIKQAGIGRRALLHHRAAVGLAVKHRRIKRQRLLKRSQRFGIFLVAEIGIAQVAVQRGQLRAQHDGLLVQADRFAVVLLLVFHRAVVIHGAGEIFVRLHRAFVEAARAVEIADLLVSHADFVQDLGVLRLGLHNLQVHRDRAGIFLARHQDVAVHLQHFARRHRMAHGRLRLIRACRIYSGAIDVLRNWSEGLLCTTTDAGQQEGQRYGKKSHLTHCLAPIRASPTVAVVASGCPQASCLTQRYQKPCQEAPFSFWLRRRR